MTFTELVARVGIVLMALALVYFLVWAVWNRRRGMDYLDRGISPLVLALGVFGMLSASWTDWTSLLWGGMVAVGLFAEHRRRGR